MAQIAPALRVLPYLIRLILPWLVEVLPRIPGLARFLAVFEGYGTQPMNDAEALRALDRAMNWRPKAPKRGFNDNASVIKVSDAINCLQQQTNNRLHWLAVMKQTIISLVGTPKNSMSEYSDAVVDCLRENALRQDTPRTAIKSTRTGRPARGHGYGRSNF